jgi:L-alanine-DL-glutamate epimerase-like enolase superfamily enzyme
VRGFLDGWYRDVVEPSFDVVDGRLLIPDRPGLGFELRGRVRQAPDVIVTKSEL